MATYAINRNFETTSTQSLTTESIYVDDHLNRAFQQIDATLTTARSLITVLDREQSPINENTLSNLVASDRLIRSLSLIDTNGLVVASSNSKNINAIVPITPLLDTVGTKTPVA